MIGLKIFFNSFNFHPLINIANKFPIKSKWIGSIQITVQWDTFNVNSIFIITYQKSNVLARLILSLMFNVCFSVYLKENKYWFCWGWCFYYNIQHCHSFQSGKHYTKKKHKTVNTCICWKEIWYKKWKKKMFIKPTILHNFEFRERSTTLISALVSVTR